MRNSTRAGEPEGSAVQVTEPFKTAPLLIFVEMVLDAAGLFTMRLVAVDVMVLPAASRAVAVKECAPFKIVVEFKAAEYGDDISSPPKLFPSHLNCTPTTPTLSDAFADTATDDPDTVALFTGAKMEIDGAVVSGGVKVVADLAADCAELFPAASFAETV